MGVSVGIRGARGVGGLGKWEDALNLEGAALRGLDPGGVGVGELSSSHIIVRPQRTREIRKGEHAAHLPDHDTSVPALRLRLLHARTERRRVHEAVGGISRGGGLADDELVEGDAVLGDLEEGGARECAAGAGEEPRAVGVQALVVELHVVLGESRPWSVRAPKGTNEIGSAPSR